MGAITRAAANNITTGGVILPAGINDASVASISDLEQVATGGGLNLISSQTASASASIEFTSGIDSTYDIYQFEFINCHPQTDAVSFQFNLSTDGGSNYSVTKTTTFFDAGQNEAGTDTPFGYAAGRDLAQSTSDQVIIGNGANLGADNDQSSSGTIYLFNPLSSTYVKHFIGVAHSIEYRDWSWRSTFAGYANTTSAVNAIIFRMSSGNIDAGTIRMYGIQSS